MNKSFFNSPYAFAALLIAGGFVAWLEMKDYAIGRGGGSDRGYLLWSGWIALTLFVVVALYTARKYVHRMGISHEFKQRVPPKNVEAAEAKINELRRKVAQGALTEKNDVAKQARAALKQNGVDKIMRVVVEPGGPNEPAFEITVRPTEPLGRVAKWMHMHLYLGLAAAVLVFVHGGANFESPMGLLLNALSFLVIATGVFGIVVWALGPSWMTKAERDLSVEEAFVLDTSIGRKLAGKLKDKGYEKALETAEAGAWKDAYLAGVQKRGRFSGDVSAGLRSARLDALTAAQEAKAAKEKEDQKAAEARVAACGELQDLMTLFGQRRRVRGTLAGLERLKHVMNVWRIIHVPLSVFLLGLLVLHVLSVWWY